MASHRTVDSFTAAVQDFIEKKAPESAEKTVRKIVLAGGGMLIKASPVKDGFFRANWYPATNAISTEVNATQKNAKLRQPLAFKLGDMVTWANNMPYAKRLESGWSKQAPQGIVAPTKRRLENMLRGKKL